METASVSNPRYQYQCNLCGSHNYTYRDHLTSRLGCDRQKFNVIKCTKCTLHSLFPIPTDFDLQQIYANYADQGDRISVEQFRMKNIYPKKISLVKKYATNGNKILDIGAGIGGFAAVAQRESFEIIGVEFEKQQCELAKRLFNVDLICTTFEEFFGGCKTKFNAIHLHHVLEHLRDPKSVLLAANRLLEENGTLILEVPNQFFVFKDELYSRLGRTRFGKPYNPYHHLYFFSPNTLKAMFRAAGFRIVEFNEVYEGVNRTVKNRINHALSRVFNMGVSSRMEVVAARQ